MRSIPWLFAAVLTIAIVASSLADDGCVDYRDFLRLADSIQIGGFLSDLAVAGDIAYVADTPFRGLCVYDVANPFGPLLIDHTGPRVEYLLLEDDLLFAASLRDSFHVFDVSEPTNPSLIASCAVPGAGRSMTLLGSTVLIAAGRDGLVAVDVSDPQSPMVVSAFEATGDARSVAAKGTIAFLADDSGYLLAIDYADVAQPRLRSSFVIPEGAMAVAVQGSLLYFKDSQALVNVIDIDDPDHLEVISQVPTVSIAREFHFAGSLAFTFGLTGVDVLDVSDPLHPVYLGSTRGNYDIHGLGVVDGYALGAAGNGGVAVFDVGDPRSPPPLGSLFVGESARRITVEGHHSFLAGERLWIVDHTDASDPTEVGSVNLPFVAQRLIVENDRVYVADNGIQIVIVDVSDPAAPAIASNISLPTRIRAVVARGNQLMVLVSGIMEYSLVVYDVTNPQAPVLSGSVGIEGISLPDVVLDGDLLYLSILTGGWGLAIYDLSDPLAPSLVGELQRDAVESLFCEGLAVGNGTAFMEVAGCLWLIDVSTPESPLLMGCLRYFRYAELAYRREVLYVGSGNHVVAFNVLDVANPVWLGQVPVGPGVEDMALGSDFVHVVSESGQLLLLPGHCAGSSSVSDDDDLSDEEAFDRIAIVASPNPFNPRVTLTLEIPRREKIALTVYDLRGRKVAVLAAGTFAAGAHRAVWDGRDTHGRFMPSGHYVARLEADSFVRSTGLTLVR